MIINRCMNCMLETTTTLCPYCGCDESEPQLWETVLKPGTILAGRYLLGRVMGYADSDVSYIGLDLQQMQRVVVHECYQGGGITMSRVEGTSDVRWSDGTAEKRLRDAIRRQRILEQLSLPCIARTQDIVAENNTVYFVMSYTDGVGLSGRIKAWDEVMRLFRPLMQSLEQLHRTGVAHGNICPNNMTITSDGASPVLGPVALAVYNRTEAYFSPEFSPREWRYGEPKPCSDVYSLASTMLYAMSGRAPIEPEDDEYAAIGIGGPECDLSFEEPEYSTIPVTARQALRHALAQHCSERTQSMSALERELEQGMA